MRKFIAIVSSLAMVLSALAFPVTTDAAPLADGLVAYWNMDDGSGTNANEPVNNLDGTLVNGPAWGTSAPVVGSTYGVAFDGSNDYVEVAHDSELDLTAAYSLSAWVNVTDVPSGVYRPIIFRGATNANDIEVYIQHTSGDLIVAHNRGNGGTFDYVGFDNPTVGSYFHLAVTFDGTDVKAYYNGVAATVVQQTTAVTAPSDTDKGWWFGKVDHAAFGGVHVFEGLLDEVRVYNRALSATEVNRLNDYGFGVTLSPTADYNPVGSDHTVTATIDPALNYIPVLFEVSGANPGDATVDTTGVGEAVFTYTGLNAGTDTIIACVDADSSGSCDNGEITATATKVWLDKFVTGGGVLKELVVIVVTQGKRTFTVQSEVTKYTFGGNVGIDVDGNFVGQFQINDHEAGVACHFSQIDSFMFLDENAVEFTAQGKCNDGTNPTVTVTISDNDEPGAGVDEIAVEGDMEFGSPITGGNFQVRFPAEFLLLRLYEKNPSSWEIIPEGASGALIYNPAAPSFNYAFTAQGLNGGTGYSLIYYADPWPGNNPGALIGSGTSDGSGNLSLSGSVELGMDLPDPADANYPGGAKIWLVLSSDYNEVTNAMTGWNPTEYLFENNLIQYDDTQVP